MRALWLLVCRVAVYVFLHAHLWRAKSWLYCRLQEPREVRDVELLTFRDFREVTHFMGNGTKWRADGWRSLWDAVHSPQYAQQAFAGVYPAETDLDCDDHARFAAAAIEHSIAEGEWRQSFGTPRLLTVTYLKGLKPGGHVVTVVSKESDRVEMWGSRFSGREYYWGDYGGLLGPFASIADVARNVRSVYAPGSSAIVHCVQDVALRPLETHWGE